MDSEAQVNKEFAKTIRLPVPTEILVHTSFNTHTFFERKELVDSYFVVNFRNEKIKIVKLKYVPKESVIFIYKTTMTYIITKDSYYDDVIYKKRNIRGIPADLTLLDQQVLKEIGF